MRFPRSRSCLSRWVIYLLFSSQLPRRDYREDKIFAPKSVRRAYSSSHKDANVESSEKNENRDTKYRTLTAVVDPNCAIDILSMCIMWLDIIKVKISESFFFFLLLLLLSWPRNKKSCCWSFRMSHVVKTSWQEEIEKKQKKLHTVTIYINLFFFFFLFFRRHLVLTTIRVLDRQNKLSLTKMKRLFGVKKTVEAPSLEETTGKVILLSSSRLLLCLCLLFSFLVAHPSKLIHFSSSNTTQNKLNWHLHFHSLLLSNIKQIKVGRSRTVNRPKDQTDRPTIGKITRPD